MNLSEPNVIDLLMVNVEGLLIRWWRLAFFPFGIKIKIVTAKFYFIEIFNK